MLTREQELTIREVLATRINSVSEAGFVRPSAQYFGGREDFWAVVDPDNAGNEIETSLIAATWIYPVNFVDDITSASAHSPLINLTYEIYHFTQYGQMREDESDTADVFTEKVLKQHANFITAWLGIKEQFQGNITIAELDPTEFVVRQTTPVVQVEDMTTQAICEFIPGVVGYDVRLRETVQIRFMEC